MAPETLTPRTPGKPRSTMPREVARRRRPGGGRAWHPTLGAGPLPRVLTPLALGLMAVGWLGAVGSGVDTSFKSECDASASGIDWLPDAGFTLDAYRTIFGQGNLPVWAVNSVVV